MTESLPNLLHEKPSQAYQAVEYKPDPQTWEEIKPAVLAIHRSEFPETDNWELEQKLERGFNDKDNTVVVLYDTTLGKPKKLIGYTFAVPMPYSDPYTRRKIPTASVDTTAIEENYRNQGLVGLLMLQLEETLKNKGYEQMERSVVTHNGYADKVNKHYGRQGRIIPSPRSTERDLLRRDRRHFLISLKPAPAEQPKAA